MNFRKKVLIILSSLSVVGLLLFFLWASIYNKASERAIGFYTNDTASYIAEDKGSYIAFSSKGNSKDVAFVFYPGKKIEAKAYSPIAGKIAEKGFDVFIAKMPLNIAFFNLNAADKIINNEKYTSYVIGGHDLGGEIASTYALKNSENIKGLILLASYPNDNTSFKNKDMKVISLYGSEDKIVNIEKVEESKNQFEKNAVLDIIKGGNHSFFGDYGKEKNDGEIETTQDQLEDITVDYITGMLKGFR